MDAPTPQPVDSGSDASASQPTAAPSSPSPQSEPTPVVTPVASTLVGLPKQAGDEGVSCDDLMVMMGERDTSGKMQNVYYNKSSAAWFFRITFNNKHVTFSVAGLGKLEHATIRECLMSVLQDSTKTNTSRKVRQCVSIFHLAPIIIALIVFKQALVKGA